MVTTWYSVHICIYKCGVSVYFMMFQCGFEIWKWLLTHQNLLRDTIFKPSRHLEASTHPIYLMTWYYHGVGWEAWSGINSVLAGDADSRSYSRNMRTSVATSRNITESGTRVATNVCSQSCKHLIICFYIFILSRGNVINPFCYIIFKFEYQTIVISLLLIQNTQQLFPLGNVQWSFGPFRALGKGCYRPTIMIHGAVSTIRQIWLRVLFPINKNTNKKTTFKNTFGLSWSNPGTDWKKNSDFQCIMAPWLQRTRNGTAVRKSIMHRKHHSCRKISPARGHGNQIV